MLLITAVPDPDLFLRGLNGGAQFGLKIRSGGGPAPALDPPLLKTAAIWVVREES